VAITIKDNDFIPTQIVRSAPPTLAAAIASPQAVLGTTTTITSAVTSSGTLPGGDLVLQAKKRKPR
jgi:hypothetical protein